MLVAAGKSDKEIAQELNIDIGWARNIVKRILAKTKFANRTQLAVFAVLKGLVDPDRINIQPQPGLQPSEDLEDET